MVDTAAVRVEEDAMTSEPVPARAAPTAGGRVVAILRWPFLGAGGVRSGWRLLAFFLLFIAASEVLESRLPAGDFTAGRLLLRESVLLLAVAGITAAMAAFERRPLREYGLPLRGIPLA